MGLNNSEKQISILFITLILGLFGCIVATPLFSDGMFLDGVIYAAVANNMALGIGSFWEPHLSNTLFDSFYEHPPLAMGLQALCFKLFGNSIYVERFYSLATFLINTQIIVLIWKELTQDRFLSFLPLLFFILIPDIQWSFSNNLLENTMMIFCSTSFYLLIKHAKTEKKVYVLFAGLLLFLSILSKGFVGLYLWGFPLFFWFFFRRNSFIQATYSTLWLLSATVIPFLVLYFFLPAGWNSFVSYIQEQVVNSLQNVQTVNSRFEIVFIFLNQIIISVALGLVVWFLVKRKIQVNTSPEETKYSYILICLVAGGVLPILISLKQRGFYILTVYPFFSLALALLLKPYFKHLLLRITVKTWSILRIVSFALVGFAFVLSLLQFNSIKRDKPELELIYFINENIPNGATLDLSEEFKENWSLHSYAARHGQYNLIRNTPEKVEFKIENASRISEYPKENIVWTSEKYALIRLRNSNSD